MNIVLNNLKNGGMKPQKHTNCVNVIYGNDDLNPIP